MKRRTLLLQLAGLFGGIFFTAGTSWATKAQTALTMPESTAPGQEITIRITVTHSANSFFHYTEWLRVQVNGTDLAGWQFNSGDRPDAAVFSKEIRYTVTGNAEIRAKASCNIHGSANEAVGYIRVAG